MSSCRSFYITNGLVLFFVEKEEDAGEDLHQVRIAANRNKGSTIISRTQLVVNRHGKSGLAQTTSSDHRNYLGPVAAAGGASISVAVGR